VGVRLKGLKSLKFEEFERFEEFEVMGLSPSHLVLVAECLCLRCGSATKRVEEFRVSRSKPQNVRNTFERFPVLSYVFCLMSYVLALGLSSYFFFSVVSESS